MAANSPPHPPSLREGAAFGSENRRYVELTIPGIACDEVLAITGHEAVQELFRFEIEVELMPPVPDLSTLMGKPASITVRDVAGHERVITGVVAEAEVVSRDTRRIVRGRFVIRPAIYRQALGRDCWASQEVTAVDVIKAVLEDYPFTVRYDLTADYPKYPYRVQYREDDWTYISRLTEEEGIYYWFDHGGGESEIVFSDESKSAPDIDGIPVLPYTPASAMKPDQSAVLEVSFSARATSHRFSARSFDMARPGFRVEAEVGSGRHEVYDAPGGGTPDPVILKQRVKVGLEGSKAARTGISGLATDVRLFPGRSFALALHPVAALDGQFFITGVDLVGDAKVGVSSKFTAIPKETSYRPLRVSKEAKQAGLQMGVVIGPDGQEVHPDGLGRVRVQQHWDRLGARNETSGTWMRIAQRGSPGSLLLPRMGWNVATFNEEGGVDAPSTVCRIHDGDHPPEYALPANKTRVVFKTATTPKAPTFNEIYFEDKLGAEEMFIHASRDMNERTENNKVDNVKGNHKRSVGQNYTLHVDDRMTDRVIKDQTVTIGGNEELVVQAGYTKEVSQDETRTIGAGRKLHVNQSHATTVEANRELTVQGSMLELTLGKMSSVSGHNMTTVGGSLARIAGGTITEDVTHLAMQDVKGMKIELATENHPTHVDMLFNETIGVGALHVSNAKYIDQADTTSTWSISSALAMDAPDVWVEANDKITIRCGSSTLTVTKTEIKIEASNVDLSGAEMDAKTLQITHNRAG